MTARKRNVQFSKLKSIYDWGYNGGGSDNILIVILVIEEVLERTAFRCTS